MNELEEARRTIDEVDRQMAALFEARMAAVGQVAAYKEAHGLPVLDAGREAQVVEKRRGEQADFEARLTALLRERRIDMIVLAGFLSILSGDFTARWPRRILNVHPSLIPSFCGAGFYGLRVHQAALDYGVKVTGATVHYVNEIPDGGEIIAQ